MIIDEGYNPKDAALLTEIKVRTAQNYLKMYSNNIEKHVSGTYNKSHGRPHNKQNETQSEFLAKHIGNNSTVILSDLKEVLCNEFDDLKLSISALHHHLIKNAVSL